MATIAEIEKLTQDLSENERAVLAAHLLGSLPSVLDVLYAQWSRHAFSNTTIDDAFASKLIY